MKVEDLPELERVLTQTLHDLARAIGADASEYGAKVFAGADPCYLILDDNDHPLSVLPPGGQECLCVYQAVGRARTAAAEMNGTIVMTNFAWASDTAARLERGVYVFFADGSEGELISVGHLDPETEEDSHEDELPF